MKTKIKFKSYLTRLRGLRSVGENTVIGSESHTNHILITYESPMNHLRLVATFLLLLCMGSWNVWGATGTINVTSEIILPKGNTTNYSSGDWTGAGAPSYSTTNDVVNDITIGGTKVGSIRFYHAGGSGWLQIQKTNGYIETVITSSAGVDVVVYMKSNGSSGKITAALTGATSQTVTGTTAAAKTLSTTSTSATLKITNTSNAAQIGYIKITPKSGGCSASPTIGNAANNGALVYSTSPMKVPVTCPSIGAGSSCEIKDYGFVWKASGDPTISDNKTQIGTDNHSTAFSGNISGTFVAGTTYYVKAYAINNGDKTTLSTGTYSFIPRSITFNSNGGSSVTTILVLSGTAANKPTDPTKSGYIFGGWYTDSGLGTAVNWSSNITSNKTYYAKWNEAVSLSSISITTEPTTRTYLAGDTFSKTGAVVTATYSDASTKNVSTSATWSPTTALTAGTGKTITASYTENGVTKTATTTVDVYAVTVQKEDEDGNTISDAGVTASASGRTLTASAGSTKYVFKGWKFGTAAGTTIASASSASTSLTGTPTGAVTVIAEFYKPLTVTWSVNGSTYQTTSNVSYNTTTSTPANPSVPSECTGSTFMGWTATQNYTGNSAPGDLFNGTSPTITGNITFYAVFADEN